MPISPSFDHQELLAIVKRRKRFIILVGLICVLVGAILFAVSPKKYRSTTTILIIPQRVPESYVRSTVSLRIEDRLASMRQQIMSRTRLLVLIDELKMFDRTREHRTDEELVEAVRKGIELQVRGNDSFVLSFTHEDRRLAMLTTSKLASFFIDENLRIREQQAVGTSDFLESQLQEIKGKLETQESLVKQYRMKYMGELPQQLDANIQALNRWQDQYRSISDTIRSTEDRVMFYQSQLSSLQKPTRPKPFAVTVPPARAGEGAPEAQSENAAPASVDPDLVREYRNKQTRLAELSAKYTDSYPEITSLKRDLERLEKAITAATSAPATPADSRQRNAAPPHAAVPEPFRDPGFTMDMQRYQQELQRYEQEEQRLSGQVKSSQVDLVTLRKKLKEVEGNIASYQQKVESIPKREQELYSINRDYENLKLSYNELLRKKLDAQVSANLEKQQKGAQFQIVDPPNLPDTPVSPSRKIFIVGTLILSVLIGVGGAFASEYLDKTIKEKEQFARYIDIPVLASLPVLPSRIYLRKKKIRDWAFVLTSFGFVVMILAVLIYSVVRSV